MAYRYEIHAETRVGLVIGSGRLSGTEITDACVAMVTDARWRPDYDEVWDLNAAEVDVSPDELDRLVDSAHTYAERIGDNRCVFVTIRESVKPLLFLFARLTADLDRTYQIVATLDEAVAWLGLPKGALDEAGLAANASG